MTTVRRTGQGSRRPTRLSVGVVAVALSAAATAVVIGAAPAGAATSATLTAGTHLAAGQSISTGLISIGSSPQDTWKYQLRLTSGGNLQLVKNYVYTANLDVYWSTGTSGADYAVINSSGNFFLHNSNWESGTAKSGMPTGALVTKAVLDTNGNLTLETAGGVAEWRSNNGLCGKTTITDGRVSTAVSAGCREVIANTWYTWGGGHGATPGRTKGTVDKDDPIDSKNDPYRIGFDCSGLTRWEFYLAMNNKDVPTGDTTADGQWNSGMNGTSVAKSDLQIGDFVYFKDGTHPVHHTAMYIGGGYILEAPASNLHIRVAPLSEYSDYFNAIHVNAF